MIDLFRNIFRATDLGKSTRTTNYLLLLTLLLAAFNSSAQQSELECNTVTNWTTPAVSFNQVSGYTGTGLTTPGNITDGDAGTGATLTLVSRRYSDGLNICGLTTTASVQININDAPREYDRGNFVGIITSANPLTTFDSFTFTMLDASGNPIGSALTPTVTNLGGGNYQVGVITPSEAGTFTGIRISATLNAPGGAACTLGLGSATNTESLQIRNIAQVNYCAGVELACNTKTNPTFPAYNVSVSSGQNGLLSTLLGLLGINGIENVQNVVSPSTSDYASFRTLAGVDLGLIGGALTGERYISVTNNLMTYPANTFAGFVIENNNLISLSLLDNYRVELWDGNTRVQFLSGSSLLLSGGLLTGSGPKTVGLIANQPFNQVRLVEEPGVLGLSVAAETRIYTAVFRKLCEAPALACNTPTRITDSNYPAVLSTANTGVSGTIGINFNVVNADNLLDANTNDPAQIVLPAGAGSGFISVKKGLSNFPTNAFVGFDVARPAIVGVDLLHGFRIKTFLNGVATTEEVGENGFIGLNTSILSGTARRIVGFIPTLPFDEIQLIVDGVSVASTTNVYSLVMQEFCPSEEDLACNNPTPAYIPANPVYINARNTGVDALLCGDCKIDDTQAVIDGSSSTYAEVILAAGIGVDASVSVANALETYPAKSFAGFEIGTATLLSADILSSIEINLYNDGDPTPVTTVSSAGLLLSATSSILDGELNRQLIGVVSELPFDEAQIVFKQTGVNLGTIRIYNAVFTGSCALTPITCNSSYYLTQTAFPAYINPARTGASGIASVDLGGVKDVWNVVSAATDDYATLGVNADVDALAQTSISVIDALNVYPSGTVAGFTISVDPELIDLGLFSALTVRTYLNGAPAGSSTVGSLIDLELLGFPIFGSGSGIYNVGFVSTQPFNEIQIVASRLVGVDLLNEIRVYGAFVDTRTATNDGSLTCITTNPDINVAYINIPVPGNVSTNDYIGSGQTVTYGMPIPGSNPTGAVPVMEEDGSYTFVATTPGVYTFEIPVCPAGQVQNCPTETLTITVLDPSKSDNPPVANVDLVNMTGSQTGPVAPVLIDVTANDKPGNLGGTLTGLSIKTTPSNGTATIVDGKVEYTPNPGFYGEEVFTYEICEDPSTICREAEVIVNVLPPGTSAIIASDDYNRTTIGSQLSAPAAGVLMNDRDAAGGEISVTTTSVSNAAGVVTFSQNGSYVYVPTSGFIGTGAFPYTASNTSGITASATLYVSVYDPGALPVKLSEFVVSKEADAAHLSWATTEEQNSERFEVERSIEGKSWHRLGIVPASGNSSIVRNYTYVDASPAEGINYYRLKMVDKDGTSAYSQVRSTSFALASEITITPNPAVENLKVKVRDAGSVEKVELISATGQVLYRSGANPLTDIEVRHLPAGMYILNITRTGGRISTHKVLKN